MRRNLLALFALFVCVYGFLPASEVTAGSSGLLGHWKFDEGQGDIAIDCSGRENDGDIWDAGWVKGKFGTALSFDGQGSHVSIPEIAELNGSDELTVEAWVYWEDSGRYPNIITGGAWSPGGFLMFVRDNQCSFRMGRPGFSASANRDQWREVGVPLVPQFELYQWYHLAATFKRPVIKTYVNGKQVSSANWDFPVGYKGDLIVGKWGGTIGHKGLIDEIKVYNRALGETEIAASYSQEAGKRSPTSPGETAYQPIPRESQLTAAVATFENDFAKLAISDRGRCIALIDKSTGEDHILRTSPFVSIECNGKTFSRARCSYRNNKLLYQFSQTETTVVIGVTAKPKYFVFRVESVGGADVDEVEFVRLNLKPCQDVNAMSGLAADDQFGVCLRTLNLQTRVDVLRNPPVLTAAGFREHGFEGVGAALAACPTAQVKQVLQDLVRNEGLPFSALGGPFARDAEDNRGSYVFARVSAKDVDQWIELARRGGIRTIHLSGWERSLGHYEPREELYPHGLEGLKSVVDRLHAAGLMVGIHTLTGCISPSDPWVTPIPDAGLATDGTFTLAEDLSDKDDSIPTAEAPGNYPTIWAYASRGNCIRIDDELIQYAGISNEPPYGFQKCKRGAFGTKVAAHKKDAKVHHMYVRYGCFIPDEKSVLVEKVADAIARVYNTCGMDQIYMDGAEAMRGWYGIARMRHAIFTRLERPALVEASCWDHHSWPFHSRVGAWDHPKWGLKRFADDHLRAVEQYRRSYLLEGQLGWWVILGPNRDWDMEMPDEIEYLCAKALAYDVPLSFQSVTATGTPPNARQEEYFTTIGRYEQLRLANYFAEPLKEKLREERQEFRLNQADDGEWQFVPTDYIEHKVTGLDDGTNTWTITNRFGDQPVRLRLHALYSAFPYDDERAMTVEDFLKDGEFSTAGVAAHVRSTVRRATNAEMPKTGEPGVCLTATNTGDSPRGAWARFARPFDPVIDMTPFDAIGLWVHGDGKGELLNMQLTNLPEYFRTLDDHYIKVDFEGWRYFELLLRERDAAAYHDYQWPYGAHCVLHRSPLVRHAVNRLTAYLNNVPAHSDVTCCLGPVKTLRTRKVILRNPTIEADGKRLVFPVELESGMYIEFESIDDCRVYDERGNMVQWLRPKGEVPVLRSNQNGLVFTCEGTDGFRSRAEVTVITGGSPVRGVMPKDKINRSLLRREYEPPRTIHAIDGVQNAWDLTCRSDAERADIEMEIRVEQVSGGMAAYESPSAVTLESFDKPVPTSQTSATFSYDSQHQNAGCSPGVTQLLSLSSETARFGKTSACYVATSTRDDNGGWSVKGKRLKKPLDLSDFAAIGFWLHGDANGQLFKLQLRDAQGGWQDMYTKVDFSGWRYCQFELGGSSLKDVSRIEAINIYYNGIPAGKTVTCYLDEIRVLRKPDPLSGLSLAVSGDRIVFPVALNAGDRLVFTGTKDCRVHRVQGIVETVQPEGTTPALRPGRNRIELSLAPSSRTSSRDDIRVIVSLVKVYDHSRRD